MVRPLRRYRLAAASLAVLLLVVGVAHAETIEDAVRAGREVQAIEQGLDAFAKKPDDPALARRLQDLLLAEGRAAEAKALVEQAAASIRAYLAARLDGPDALDALDAEKAPPLLALDLALAWLEDADPRKAERALKPYIAAHAEDPEAWEVLGRIKHAIGTCRSARQAFEKALELDAGRPGAATALSELHWEEGREEAAARVLEQALARFPKSTTLRLGWIDDRLRRGEAATAKDLAAALAKDRPRDVRVLYRHAQSLRHVERLDEAAKVAAVILQLAPGHARAHEIAGFVLEKKGKFAEALDRYLEAVKLDPGWPEVCVSAAFMQLRLGDLEYAEQMLERAFDLEKHHVGAHRLQGLIEFRRDKFRDAKKHLKYAVKADAEDVAALRILGYISLAEGKPKDALEYFRKISDLAKRDAASLRMVGRCLAELGKLEEALDALTRAKDLDDADAWTHLDIGKVHADKGDFDEAKSAYEQAIKLDDRFSWPHIYLAEIYDEVDGDTEKALDHYERFLELGGPDPDEEIARRVRQIKRN